MKEKLISFFLWVFITLISIYTYGHFISSKAVNANQNFGWNMWQTWPISDEQLKQMADRIWMSVDDLKKEIDGWKTIRQIMQEKWLNFWRWTWSWSMRWSRTWSWSFRWTRTWSWNFNG